MSKVLISALGAETGGAMRHLKSFLPNLSLHAGRFDFTVLLRRNASGLDATANVRLQSLARSLARNTGSRILVDNLYIPLQVWSEKFDCVVSLTNFGPIWAPAPHIFFQRNANYYCPYYLERVHGRMRIETLLRRRLAVASMKHADVIVTPSNSMAEMIQDSYPELRSRSFAVLYHGFDFGFFSDPLGPKILRDLALSTGFKLLYPALPGRHKGFEILFETIALLKNRGLSITLFVTIEPWETCSEATTFRQAIAKLGVTDNIRCIGRVPERQIGALYEACDLMVYPSLCESFGFPLLEAMGHALPIVASGTSINREMCEGAALYYGPLDSKGAAAAIEAALDPSTRMTLIDKGQLRFRSFDWSWKRYVKEFVEILDRAN